MDDKVKTNKNKKEKSIILQPGMEVRLDIDGYGNDILGIIQIEDDRVYVCQDVASGSSCNNKFDKLFSWVLKCRNGENISLPYDSGDATITCVVGVAFNKEIPNITLKYTKRVSTTYNTTASSYTAIYISKKGIIQLNVNDRYKSISDSAYRDKLLFKVMSHPTCCGTKIAYGFSKPSTILESIDDNIIKSVHKLLGSGETIAHVVENTQSPGYKMLIKFGFEVAYTFVNPKSGNTVSVLRYFKK